MPAKETRILRSRRGTNGESESGFVFIGESCYSGIPPTKMRRTPPPRISAARASIAFRRGLFPQVSCCFPDYTFQRPMPVAERATSNAVSGLSESRSTEQPMPITESPAAWRNTVLFVAMAVKPQLAPPKQVLMPNDRTNCPRVLPGLENQEPRTNQDSSSDQTPRSQDEINFLLVHVFGIAEPFGCVC